MTHVTFFAFSWLLVICISGSSSSLELCFCCYLSYYKEVLPPYLLACLNTIKAFQIHYSVKFVILLLFLLFYVFGLTWCRSTPNYGYKMKAESWIDSVLSDKTRHTLIKETTKIENGFSSLQLWYSGAFITCWCGSTQSTNTIWK